MLRQICCSTARRPTCTTAHTLSRCFATASAARATQTAASDDTSTKWTRHSSRSEPRTQQVNRSQRSDTDGRDDATPARGKITISLPAPGADPDAKNYEELVQQIYHRRTPDTVEYCNVVAFGLLDELQTLNLHPTNSTMTGLTVIAADARDFINIDRMLSLYQAYWSKPSSRAVAGIINAFCAKSCYEQAIVFAKRQHEQGGMTPNAWYLLLRELFDAGECSAALEMYKLALQETLNPRQDKIQGTAFFYTALVVFAQSHHADGLQWIWNLAVRSGRMLDIDAGSLTLVLNACARTGLPALATEAMQLASKLEITLTSHHYSCLVEAYVVTKDLRNALAVLPIMRSAGVTPTVSTADSIVRLAATSAETIEECFYTLLAMHAEQQPVDLTALNAIIDACTLHADATRALACFDEAVASLGLVPDSDTLDALLRVCVSARQQPLAVSLLDRFANDFPTVKMSQHAYECIITVYLLRSSYEEAFDWLERCKDEGGFVPSVKLYRALLRRLISGRDARAKVALDEMRGFGHRDERLARYVAAMGESGGDVETVAELERENEWAPVLNVINCGVLDRIQLLATEQMPFVPAERDTEVRAALEFHYGPGKTRANYGPRHAPRASRDVQHLAASDSSQPEVIQATA